MSVSTALIWNVYTENMSVWLWNETKYRYEEGKEDELGFKTFTEFLNCYTNKCIRWHAVFC